MFFSLDYIVEEAEHLNYSIIPLTNLVKNGGTRIAFEKIAGHDLIRKNLNYADENPNVFYSEDTDEKVVALTFDDYGSDKTVTIILDMLEEHGIESTFF